MPSDRRVATYERALTHIFGRRLSARDGVAEARLRRTEKRLRIAIPSAVREFYGIAGEAKECREHNRLYWPEELEIEDDRLAFMEENQAVVDWAISLAARRRVDPEVWQRANEEGAPWYSEDMTFSVFILKNLAWQRGVELSNKRMQLTRSAMADGRRGPRS